MRVAICDDDADFLWLVAMTIAARPGYAVVHEAGTVPALLAALEREPVDVVLVDHITPGTRGDEAVRLIRERDPDVVVIVMSAVVRAVVEGPVLAAGADGFIEKGLAVDELADRFEEIVRERSSSSDP